MSWAGRGLQHVCLHAVLSGGPTWPAPPLAPPPIHTAAVATGVAVAAFQRVREAYAGKHVVIVVCGGNISAEGLQAVYSVAASAAAS